MALTGIPSSSAALMLLLCGVATLVYITSAETFTALVHLENALQAERDLAYDIKSYIKKEEERLQELARLSQKFESHAQDVSQKDLEHFLSNPVAAYHTIKSLRDGSIAVQSLMGQAASHATDFTNGSALASKLLPTDEDLTGAIAAMLRLQDTYEVPTYKLVDGSFLNDDTVDAKPLSMLSSDDCFEIGKSAYLTDDFYHAVLWLQEALEQIPHDTPDYKKVEILDYLAIALYKQGNIKRALIMSDAILAIQPDMPRIQKNRENFVAELGPDEASSATIPDLMLQRYREGQIVDNDYLIYEQLCRGEEFQPIPHASQLRCQYTNKNGHPLLMYSPAREEELYHNPRIVFYHQLLTDLEIDVIKSLSVPKLHRSGVFSKPGENNARNYRTSKSAWIEDDSHPVIAGLSKKISAVSGLSLQTVEDLQVLNYGIGGHYSPHYDFASVTDPGFSAEWGNRIATFLNYVSDVKIGGATVFTKLGAIVWPEKGGALFWYNLLRDGSRDMRTLHAACPVLSGYKWVANKWFHERTQEFRRPCSLIAQE